MKKQAWRVFKNHDEYKQGMARLIELASSELPENSAEDEEFELLSLLIAHYEDKNFPIDKPTPIEAIKFRMDQSGLKQKDMNAFFGSASKTSEILAGKRKLSLSMIRKLHEGLGIPLDILVQDINAIETGEDTVTERKSDARSNLFEAIMQKTHTDPLPSPKGANYTAASERRSYDHVQTH